MADTREDKINLSRSFERAAAFRPKNFAHEIGIDIQKYLKGEPASYAAVNFYHEQGSIHGAHAFVTPITDSGIRIEIDHWVHRPNGSNVLTRILEIEAQRVADDHGIESVVVKRALIQGKEIDITDRNKIEAAIRMCRESITQMRLHNKMPRLAVMAAQAGFAIELPDTYPDGQARFDYETGIKKARKYVRVPAKFVSALTGFGNDLNNSASLTDPDNANVDYFAASELSRTGNATVASIALTRKDRSKTGDDREQAQEICRLSFTPVAKEKDYVELTNLLFDGRELPLSDHQNIVRTLNFAHDANLHMSQGAMPNMSQILNYTKLQDAISGLAPLKAKEKARHTFRVMGGNPDGQRLYKQDESIGANSFLHRYEWVDGKGKVRSKSLLIDWGITPIKNEHTGVDGMMAYLGYHFEHRYNKRNAPVEPVQDVVVTHHHIDHFMGIPHALAAGYVIPRIICNEATKMYIEAECKKLGVPEDWMPGNWRVIEDNEDVDLGEFKLTFGSMSHSAITNWVNVKTSEGSALHLSDSKRDDTIQSHEPVSPALLQALKPTVTLLDSTHSGDDHPTKTEKEVEDNVVNFLEANPNKNVIAFHISSNAARMVTMTNAFGRTKRNTVVMGAAMQFLKKVLDKVKLRDGKSLKAHANDMFGTKIVNFSAKSQPVQEMLHESTPGTVSVLATGTHNEAMSIVNRLIEDKDQKNLGFLTPDKWVIILSQTAIPGNAKQFNLVVDTLRARGFEVLIEHSSGHGGKPDAIAAIKDTNSPYYIATHGNNQQRAATADVIREQGKIPLNPNEQDVIQVSDKHGCKIVAQASSTMVYFSVNRPKDVYYGGREDVEYYPHRVAPLIRTPVGEMLRDIHRIKRDEIIRTNPAELQLTRQLSGDSTISGAMNDSHIEYGRVDISLPDFLIRSGIMRRMIYDTETTQRSALFSWITQFAATQKSWLDINEAAVATNIRQTIPQHVLPDLGALLKTKLAPSDIYKTGEGHFPPREFMHEIMKACRQSQVVGKNGATKVYVDEAKKPADPRLGKKTKKSGDPYLKQSMVYNTQASDGMERPHAVNAKTILAGFNNIKFDDPIIRQAAFRAGYAMYAPMSTKGMRRYDIRNAARLFAYLVPEKFKSELKPETQFRDFSVEGVIRANKLTYNAKGAHAADVDIEMEDAIMRFMMKVDPELFIQSLMNTDDVSLKNFLKPAGMMDTRRLLTYINNTAKNARANIGVYVGHSKNEKFKNKAVIFNVSDFDPKEFDGVTAEVFARIMSDPEHKLHRAFEVIDLKKHPLIASADRGFAVGASRGTSIETMEARRRFISSNTSLITEIVRGMEMSKYTPEHDTLRPMEERIYTVPFMKLSEHDRKLAALFEPQDAEFTDRKFAERLNRERANTLDKFNDHRVRERYVAVMFLIEQEFEKKFGIKKLYLHKDDRAHQKALEKARIHARVPRNSGFGDNNAVALGDLKWQIKEAREGWDKILEGKTSEEKAKLEQIVTECEKLVKDIEKKIAAGHPDWALTREDLRLLGLDDNKPYGRYQAPVARNVPANRNKKPKAPEVA